MQAKLSEIRQSIREVGDLLVRLSSSDITAPYALLLHAETLRVVSRSLESAASSIESAASSISSFATEREPPRWTNN